MLKQLPPIRAMTLKELAARYLVSTKTMKRWILRHRDKIGDAIGRFYLGPQVQTMIAIFGPFVVIPE